MKNSKNSQNLKFLYLDTDRTAAYWERTYNSKDYQELIKEGLYNHTYRATLDLFVAECRLKSQSEVLEIGCGWGRSIIGLCKQFPGIRITGIDLSSSVIEPAREIIQKEAGKCDFTIGQGNAEALRFPDQSFDAVISTRVFQYVNDPQKALREVHRVLRPNGRVAILVPNRFNPIRAFTYHTQLLSNSAIAAWMREAGLRDIKKGTIVFFPPTIKRFHEESAWVAVDRFLSRIPLVNFFGGLAWASARKNS